MGIIEVRDMGAEDEYYISSCTHVNESAEIDSSAGRRLAWLKNMYERGLRAKVATLDGEPAGFIYVMPIELCPWGPRGRDLAAFPCLYSHAEDKSQGVGRALVAAAEAEARVQEKKGIVTYGYFHDFWFMPAAYFEKLGYDVAARRGDAAILWKVFDSSAEAPSFLKAEAVPAPLSEVVTVDLFFNSFCGTSDVEAQRVREVAAEFGDAVALREYDADDPAMLRQYGRSRGIFVDGEGISWGYEAPREGIREAIAKALARERKK